MSSSLRATLQASAWVAFIEWAAAEPQMQQAYQEATRHTLPSAPRSPLERMIDDATGYEDKALFDFMKWVTVEHWGLGQAPKAFQRAVKEATQ